MMKIYKNKTKLLLSYLTLITPVILAYLFIFLASMESALDRLAYIQIMGGINTSRIEPMLPTIGRVITPLVASNSVVALITTQTFFFVLLLISLYKYFKPYSLGVFAKCMLALMLILLINSLVFGVQLRIGYASIFFLYIIISLRKFNLISFLILCIPSLMHYALIVPTLIYTYLHIFQINNNRAFIRHTLILFIPFTAIFVNIETVFNILGIPSYYYMYINESAQFGRSFPYTALFYLLNFSYLVIFHRYQIKDKFYWFSLSGLWLIYIGFFLQFYLAFKLLTPIIMVSIIYTVKQLPSYSRYSIIYLILLYVISPITFYYLSIVTQLKLF